MHSAQLQAPQWRQAVAEATARLEAAGVESAAKDALTLAEYALESATSTEGAKAEDCFESAVARRARREPLQHITGTMHFRFLELKAAPGTFVVRPETEWMADVAIDDARRRLARARAGTRLAASGAGQFAAEGGEPLVVDLCAGSGALALAVATEVPGTRVWAVELSEAALATARANNAAYGNAVHLVRGDALTALPGLEGRVDIVVSNPPYVPATDAVSPEAKADPALALYGGGEDGLAFPRALVARAAKLLRPGGLLVMEHAPSQSADLRAHALACGFAQARTGEDAAGRERWLEARMPASAPLCGAGSPGGAQAGVRGPEGEALRACILGAREPHEYPAAIAAACAALGAGELVVLPTDTVYGIGANPADRDAVARLLEAKGRGRGKPSPVLVACVADAERLVRVDARARALMEAFWPGALTLVLPARDAVAWDLGETNGTVAVRMPAHPVALALLEAAGPLAVSSANLTDMPAARSAAEARQMLGGKVACYLEAGEAPGAVPSAIVALDGAGARIVRSGGVSDKEILDALAAVR